MRKNVLKKPRSSKSATRGQRRGDMAPAWIIGLASFTVMFGAVFLFAFRSSQFDRAHRQHFVSVDRADNVPSGSSLGVKRKAFYSAGDRNVRRELTATSSMVHQVKFESCARVRRNCVVDGDTFWFEGVKIRIADIDTPEVSRPQCARERRMGVRATNRLIALLNEGPFELWQTGAREVDIFGRRLLIVARNGSSLGDQLVSEELAHQWLGKKESWCNQL